MHLPGWWETDINFGLEKRKLFSCEKCSRLAPCYCLSRVTITSLLWQSQGHIKTQTKKCGCCFLMWNANIFLFKALQGCATEQPEMQAFAEAQCLSKTTDLQQAEETSSCWKLAGLCVPPQIFHGGESCRGRLKINGGPFKQSCLFGQTMALSSFWRVCDFIVCFWWTFSNIPVLSQMDVFILI